MKLLLLFPYPYKKRNYYIETTSAAFALESTLIFFVPVVDSAFVSHFHRANLKIIQFYRPVELKGILRIAHYTHQSEIQIVNHSALLLKAQRLLNCNNEIFHLNCAKGFVFFKRGSRKSQYWSPE